MATVPASRIPSPVSDSTGGGTVVNNKPVGAAGQPVNNPKMGAIQRRLSRATQMKKGNL